MLLRRKRGGRARRWALALAAIFVVAFVVRLILVRRMAIPVVLDLIWNDAVGWNIAQGNGFTASPGPPYVPGLFRTPGYPMFLALVYKLFGHSVYAAFAAHAALYAGTAVMTVLIARRFFAPRVALAAGAMYALYPYPAIYCGQLHQDILLTFTAVAFFLCLIHASQHTKSPDHDSPGRIWHWVGCGVLLGILVVIKSIFVLFFPVPALVAWLSQASARRRVLAVGAVGLAMCAVVSPLLARNYQVFGRFPLLSIGGTGTIMQALVQEIDMGEDAMVEHILAGGNQKTAVEKQRMQERVRKWSDTAIYDEERNREYLATFPDGVALIEHESRQARQWGPELQKRRAGYLGVALKHLPRLWLTQRAVSQSGVVARVGQLLSWAVLGLGLTGMALLWRRRREMAVLYLSIVIGTVMYMPYTVEARYTMPLHPLMIIFIAGGAWTALSALQVRRTRSASRQAPA